MSIKTSKEKLLELLAPPFKAHDFVLNKQLGEFTRRRTAGWEKFQLIFLKRKDGWEINLGMLIRKDIIENIYHQASSFDPKYHKTTPTLGITVEKFRNDGNEYRFYLSSDSDIEKCTNYIEDLFIKVALPFFEQYDNLGTMDKAVNVKNGESIFSGLKYQGNLGIILAKLMKSPDYDFFLKKYYNYYKNLSCEFYLPEYEKLLKILDSL